MPFPEIIAKAQRDSLLQNVIEALDLVEEIRRNIGDAAPHLVALDAATFSDVSQKITTAYSALASARNTLGDA